MRAVVFFHLIVRHGSIEQLFHNLLLVGVGEQTLAVEVQLAAEVLLHILLGLVEHHGLAYPLVDIVCHYSHAVVVRHTLAYQSLQVALPELVAIDAGHQGRLVDGLPAGCHGEQEYTKKPRL